MYFKKKAVVIRAVQYTGDNRDEIIEFTRGLALGNTGSAQLTIPTLEGPHFANVGDWIIQGVKGEFYPCKPDIFEMTYEATEDRP